MNARNSRKSTYLEDITASAEYQFAIANAHHGISTNRVTYYDAFNHVGEKIYRLDWTGREFFARRSTTDIEEYKSRRKITYSLFQSENQENECAERIGYAEYPILTALRAGDLVAYYIDHHTGEEISLKPEFWRSQKCSFTRITGLYQFPERNKRPAVPGIDFIVVLDRKSFQRVLKTMPKRTKKNKAAPSKKSIQEARRIIIDICNKNKVFLNRPIYALALNDVLKTDYFNDENIKPYWREDIPDSLKNTKRISDINYLSLVMLPKSQIP